MLRRWEEQTGFSLTGNKTGELHPLLIEAADQTVGILEEFYSINEAPENEKHIPEKIDERISVLCRAVLSAAEQACGLPSDGDGMERLFRIRYNGVDSFYPEHIDPAEQPVMKRALLDFRALKAEVSIRHSQIIDVLEYIRTDYINPPFSAGRGCEFILNLLDLINRTNGGDISGHYTPREQHAVVMAGEPLVYDENSRNGSGRRDYLDRIKDEVRTALQETSGKLETIWKILNLNKRI